MNSEIKNVIEKFKEAKNILKAFDNKDKAIKYLVNETKLSKGRMFYCVQYYYENQRLNYNLE